MADSAQWSGSSGPHLEERFRRLLERLAPNAAKDRHLHMIRPADLEPNPWGPQAVLDPESQEELADRVLSYGIKEPLLARRLESGRYQVLSGARVLAAARQIGLPAVPVNVIDVDEPIAVVIALTEALAREAVTPWEEAQGLAELRESLERAGHEAPAEELSLITGHSVDWASDRLRIVDRLTPGVLERAGVAVHDLNVIPRDVLLDAAEAENEAGRAERIRRAVASEEERTGGAP